MQCRRCTGHDGAPSCDRAIASNNEPNLAIALRHRCIDRGGEGEARGVRMIMADDRRATVTRGAMRSNQHCRIDLEAMERLRGDVGGRAQLHDPRAFAHRLKVAQQQPATFICRGNARVRAYIIQQSR